MWNGSESVPCGTERLLWSELLKLSVPDTVRNVNMISTSASPRSLGAVNDDGRSLRWEQHRRDRREDLLQRAVAAVHRCGAQASMEDIAREAKTSKPTFYRYFGDKAGLARALGEHLLHRLRERMESVAATATTPEAVVHGMVETYLMMVQRSPAVHEFVTTGSGLVWHRVDSTDPTGSLGNFADHVSDLLIRALRRQGAEGSEHSAPDALTHYWARGAIGMVVSVTDPWSRTLHEPGAPDREQVLAALTTWIMATVSPPDSS